MAKPSLLLFSARGREGFTPRQRESLEREYTVTYSKALSPLSEKEFTDLLTEKRAAGITPRALPTKLSPGFWSAHPHLETVFLPTTGTEWFPLAEVTKTGIRVKNLPGYSGQSTAEFAWALILAAERHVIAANRRVLDGESSSLLGRELSGRNLGVIGCGDVGKRVARIGEAFELNVTIFDKQPVNGFRQDSLENLVRSSDVLSLHLPLTEDTRALFGSWMLTALRPGTILVNTARPALLDFDLVRKLLDTNRLGVYAVDQGYLPRNEILPLATHPKVIAVPHISWYTVQAIERELEMWTKLICEDVRR